MILRSLPLLFFAFAFVACGGEETDGKFSKEEMQTQQTAWKNMMDVHDVVMPLTKPMYDASKQLGELRDAAVVESTDFHPRAQQVLADLDAADNAMNDWMVTARDNPLKAVRDRYPDHAAVMSYIDSEKEKIDAVAEQMKASLAAAKSLIQEREPAE